jgi:hypothetical protein
MVGDDEVPSPLVRRLDLDLVERSTTSPPKTGASMGASAVPTRAKKTVREDR